MAKAKNKAKKRPRGRPFRPGQSGNPGGRPKSLTEFRLVARGHSARALRVLLGIMQSKKASAAARVAAVRELFDRAWGRPPQELLVEGSMVGVNAQLPGDTFDSMSRAQKVELAGRLAFLLARGASMREKRAGGRM